MTWKKLGRIFCPNGNHAWMQSHAANPVADHVRDGIHRIYFSTRDASNRSSITWLEVDLRHPDHILRLSEHPVLSPGPIGAFDDSGCSLGSMVRDGRRRFLFYMGWNLGVTVPWRNAIGLAISEDEGETFHRVSSAPIVDRSDEDPYTLSYPWVLKSADGWRMWYGSNLTWGASQADMCHMIKCATSDDGRVWRRDGKVVIHPRNDAEYAFARPAVTEEADGFRMWYAYRGEAYRIGYAESVDGIGWTRHDDQVGIAPTPGDWDGASVTYPSVFSWAGRRYLLYCGNGYGKTGFGLAVLDED